MLPSTGIRYCCNCKVEGHGAKDKTCPKIIKGGNENAQLL